MGAAQAMHPVATAITTLLLAIAAPSTPGEKPQIYGLLSILL